MAENLHRDLPLHLDILQHQIGAHMRDAGQAEQELFQEVVIGILVAADDVKVVIRLAGC